MNFKNLFKKQEILTPKEYFERIHPTYVVLQIVPDTSIRNYTSEDIGKMICNMYKLPIHRFSRDGFKITYNLPEKVSFMIDISVKDCKFYIVCPANYEKVIREKCSSVWSKATIKEIKEINRFSDEAMKYQVFYERKDALSLKVDKRCNEPLNSILNVTDIMEDNDRVGVVYNFMPCSQRGWRMIHKEILDKYKQGLPMEKEFLSITKILKMAGIAIEWVLETALGVVTDFLFDNEFGASTKSFSEEMALTDFNQNQSKKLSSFTREKGDDMILKTQIVVMSDSKDKRRKLNNAIAVCESYKVLGQNNNLTYKRLNNKGGAEWIGEFKVAGVRENTMSTKEVQNLWEIPGRSLLQQHKNIEKIEVLENPIPGELLKGDIRLGLCKIKEKYPNAYFTTHREYSNLTLVLIGPTRSGKTTYIINYMNDCINSGQCVIVVDFCENCEITEKALKHLGKEKCLVIDCSNESNLQGLGYNEIKSSLAENNNVSTYMGAKMMTKQLVTFINSINDSDKVLTSKMKRYLKAAAMVVFITGDTSVKNVVDCLQNHIVRSAYIERIPEEEKNNMEEYIMDLKELDEIKEIKEGKNVIGTEVVGTKTSKIDGITDRIDSFKDNAFMELMYKQSCENNINFVEEIQKPQAILIKMPDFLFQTKEEKDMITTYWTSKIWLAAQIRSHLIPDKNKRTKVACIIDEIYQTSYAEGLVRDKLSQAAKFRLRFVLSCHYLNQISIIRDELRSANASYMLISGCDEKNYDELSDKLKPYTAYDLLHLPPYSSLNLIKHSTGYATFVTKLPPQIE